MDFQAFVVIALFVVSLLYVGAKVYKSTQSKKNCAGGCGDKCGKPVIKSGS